MPGNFSTEGMILHRIHERPSWETANMATNKKSFQSEALSHFDIGSLSIPKDRVPVP